METPLGHVTLIESFRLPRTRDTELSLPLLFAMRSMIVSSEALTQGVPLTAIILSRTQTSGRSSTDLDRQADATPPLGSIFWIIIPASRLEASTSSRIKPMGLGTMTDTSVNGCWIGDDDGSKSDDDVSTESL